MKTFLRRLGRTILDLVTSKKAIAATIGAVATAAGQPAIGAVLGSYVLAQGVADHGKEAEKKRASAAPVERTYAAESGVRSVEVR